MNADDKMPSATDWVLANPWLWMGIGLGATALAWLWVLLFEDNWEGVRFFLLGVGLLAAGGAAVIRLSSSDPPYLANMPGKGMVLGGLALVYGSLAVILTALSVLRLFGLAGVPWKPGSLVVVWFVVVPMSAVAARLGLRRGPQNITRQEEASALLALAALACFFACRALYLGEVRVEEWDTIRLLLSVLAFVAVVAAPLMVVPQNVRRAVVSAIVVLHFGGICTAVLAAPPTPWVISQLWTRIYHPYLEFMYVNNAYHYYAPEPGPASYLWFRLEYDARKNDKDPYKPVGHWVKIPEIDDHGWPEYHVALEYQRILALTENTTTLSQPPPTYEVVGTGSERRWVAARFFARRLQHAPDFKPMLGEPAPAPNAFRAPFHPQVTQQQQYFPPSVDVKIILSSYARHVTRIPYPGHPEYKILGVKIYRVIHAIPPPDLFIMGVDPRDPELYRPYYMGEFDPDGTMTVQSRDDPFLYWLLPIMQDENGFVRDYARLHAGDLRWMRTPGTHEWIARREIDTAK